MASWAAQRAMTGIKPEVCQPRPAATAVYGKLFRLYRCLHDSFGLGQPTENLAGVMKQLLVLRAEARRGSAGA